MFLLFTWWCDARSVIQIKDFLCGCEYCVTVSPNEPLDIGRHMIRCHSWRDSTLKTVQMMEDMDKENPYDIPAAEMFETLADRITPPKPPEPELTIVDDPFIDYTWKQTSLGWTYSSDTHMIGDIWMYTQKHGWLWSVSFLPDFMYSTYYGWLYKYIYNRHDVFYWYDRRMWVFPKDLHK